jgi:hypothetical protein
MTAEDDQPYVVESPSRIKLSPEAKYWAEQHGMTLTEMARYLLQQHAQQQEQEQHASNFEGAGSGLSGEPSGNVEDRRDENFVPDKTMHQIWGTYPHDVAPHAETFGPQPFNECAWVQRYRQASRPCATSAWTDRAPMACAVWGV